MDGKHVLIKCSVNSKICYFNCKSTFGIILLVSLNAYYKIVDVDVGCNDRVSNGEVIRNWSLGEALE